MVLQAEGIVLGFSIFGSIVVPFHARFCFHMKGMKPNSVKYMECFLTDVHASQSANKNPGSTNIPVSGTFHHFLDCTVTNSSSAAISLTVTL
jgi:hypothetical protein